MRMRRHWHRLSVALIAAGLLLPTAVFSQARPDYREPAGKDWPVWGGNWSNQKYSTLNQINTSNVAKLGGAWVQHIESGNANKYSQQSTPVVKDGVMYVTSGQQDVFALDAKTGAPKWRYDSDADPKTGGIWTNRGVAVADGKVFAGQVDGRMVALDQKTGKQLWNTALAPEVGKKSGRYLSNAPTYYDGVLYTGLSGGGAGLRGRLSALDANTGAELWRFYTIPGPGEFGHDTWEGNSWQTGGGAVWNAAALDPDLGLIYIQTGNAWPEDDGSVRGGDNLFSASVVAIDHKTGAYRWHFQLVHHDIWDYDTASAPVLFDTVIDGRPRKGLAQASKMGWLYLLDRATGEPLVGIEERAVPQEPRHKTAATQPYPIGDAYVDQCPVDPVPGYLTGCIYTPFWDVPVIGAPGGTGGTDTAPISYSPQTGFFYVPGSNSYSGFSVRHEALGDQDERLTLGGVGLFEPIGNKHSGTLTAIDGRTNKIVWQKKTTYPIGFGSGTMTTAGGLIFHGEPDGNFVAHNAQNGDELWRFQTGFGADAPAVTYELDGEQYVAIAAGGNRLSLSERGDAVWAFKLNGTLPTVAAPKPPPTVLGFTNTPVQADTVSIGRLWDSGKEAPGGPAEYAFGPDRIKVAVGTAVTWTNQGDIEHTATSQDGIFDTGLLKSGESASVTFDTPGSYSYNCNPHPWMVGEVIVE
jgi:alcohol dehydrogenase (cytochrome c)